MSDCTIRPKLKPCPFCGGEAKLVKQIDGRYALERYSVSCNMCGLVAFYEPTEAEAVKAWNTRYAEITIKGEQWEELKREIVKKYGDEIRAFMEVDSCDHS